MWIFKLSGRVRATMQHLLWEGWYYCFCVNWHWARVRCVGFDQKTKGDRVTIHKFSTGPPWFLSLNSFNVRCHSCCHIVRPTACIGSWLYWTYLLRLIKQTVLSRTTWRRTRIFRPGKRQNLASAMLLNRGYSWKYRKVKFMCAISFLIIIIFKTRGDPTTDFPLNALKTH